MERIYLLEKIKDENAIRSELLQQLGNKHPSWKVEEKEGKINIDTNEPIARVIGKITTEKENGSARVIANYRATFGGLGFIIAILLVLFLFLPFVFYAIFAFNKYKKKQSEFENELEAIINSLTKGKEKAVLQSSKTGLIEKSDKVFTWFFIAFAAFLVLGIIGLIIMYLTGRI